MAAVLLDTHAWVWSLNDSPRLPATVRDVLAEAEAIYVSPITFFEIAQKVRIGKWPEMEEHVDELPGLLAVQGGLVAALTPEACVMAGMLDWTHRDPFDRLLAATSMTSRISLVSADAVFDQLVGRNAWRTRIW